ncbi:MAG: ABC transporter substrate-binding protein [Pegethrix bostrychoides GSE-TBD4-15B]|jgi:NitT/TauT family transport system substrate-binding protein|uniref:ABC transporter substrate-binding protein n=1 Tax=Pegethrix bostrychoides GSE-TBD4-15B TaxID=2839662 RepID=A0A951U4Z8_9CYAN|nr:ABC transporter substrate-binding protein [Pegethrix bostrychoides GSE-TBD4-15B]
MSQSPDDLLRDDLLKPALLNLDRASLNRRRFMSKLIQYGGLAVGSGVLTACAGQPTSQTTSQAPDPAASSPAASPSGELKKITYGTNWYAQAEHGGFYQAVATGIYRDYGLDVTIKMGGPQVNGTQLLMGGAIDFFMGYVSDAIKAVQENIPKVTVAAMFQKDPQVLLAHPESKAKSLADLKDRPTFIGAAANTTFWPFLKAKFSYSDAQKRPYNFNPAPFLADKTAVQQGYLSSEPLAIRKEGGFEPLVFLLADYGYDPYSTTIECKQSLVDQDPDLVQRFVDASIKGWYSYLNGDPAPANALIKQDNPEMTDEQIQYSIEKMKEYGIVVSGSAETQGIGSMTDERWKSFFDTMSGEGIFPSSLDYKKAYTLKFVNKGVDAYKS